MLIENVVKKNNRDYEEEKNILLEFSQILKPYISLESIQKKLETNGFKGVYILNDHLFKMVSSSENTLGIYSGENKAIILNRKDYIKNKSIGIHEMGHAYLDGSSSKEITLDDSIIIYGNGLEEAAMAIFQCNLDIKNINKQFCNIYPYPSILFKQLDILYKNSNCQKYDNLLIHLFMEPETLIPLIRNIYEDIYTRKMSCLDEELITKSAFYMISGIDTLVGYNDKLLYSLLCCMNSIYLNFINTDVEKKEYNEIFFNLNDFRKTKEEILLFKIFNSDINYMKRLELNLKNILSSMTERLEKFDNEENSKTKIIMPR